MSVLMPIVQVWCILVAGLVFVSSALVPVSYMVVPARSRLVSARFKLVTVRTRLIRLVLIRHWLMLVLDK